MAEEKTAPAPRLKSGNYVIIGFSKAGGPLIADGVAAIPTNDVRVAVGTLTKVEVRDGVPYIVEAI